MKTEQYIEIPKHLQKALLQMLEAGARLRKQEQKRYRLDVTKLRESLEKIKANDA